MLRWHFSNLRFSHANLFFDAVLFSDEKRLVSKETPSEIGRRVFKSYDPEGNNFIPTPVLQDVLCALDLVSEPE